MLRCGILLLAIVGDAVVATASPDTRPATTRAADDTIPELAAATSRLHSAIRQEVRDGTAQPTDREKAIYSFSFSLLAAGNDLNLKNTQKAQAELAEKEKRLSEQLRGLREKHAGDDDIQKQITLVETVSRELLHSLDFLHASPGEDDRSVQLDLARRLNLMLDTVDRADALKRDVEHQTKRLNILLEIAQLKRSVDAAGSVGQAAREKLQSNQELLKAIDLAYDAQLKVDRISNAPTTGPSTAPVHPAAP